MEPTEYDLPFFHREGFHRRSCAVCGSAFWTLGEADRCQEGPCSEYSFIGRPVFSRPRGLAEMREAFLTFLEHRGHRRVGRYPVVARWRNDVFFTQASIYDFQPWVTNGTVLPPANPLAISQPVVRFNDLEEVGRSGRHFTLFEMMAHHAFNRPDHEVYFKDRTVELCQELLASELGADPRAITYKEEEWEGGGNLGPSLSVGVAGLELATLVFMEYVRDGDRIRPMPLTVVDTGYGLERFVWASHGTKMAYEPVFAGALAELHQSFPGRDGVMLVDHARAVNFLITDGVVPSNSKEGYFARLLLRRMLRTLARVPQAPDLLAVLDRVGQQVARDYPEVGRHRDDFRRVVEAELQRYEESIGRARSIIRRQEERLAAEGRTAGPEELGQWYESLGIPPEVAVEELRSPPPIPADFYTGAARRHESEAGAAEEIAEPEGLPEVPSTVPATDARYPLDPYTLEFEAHVVFRSGPFVALDRTYFYPTGGGQITDTGTLGDARVSEVVRHGAYILHRLEPPATYPAGERVRGRIDAKRRRQLMQHHTATHLLNGALREALGPHVWQAGAYKGTELARIDITHFRALSDEELAAVERRVNEIVREDRPVRSYFERRDEAERRFGFTLYQGGAVPGRDLRIVEVEGFDVEACGGTHCTHTSEVGFVSLLGTQRIQDGIVRLTYAAGDRALELHQAEHRSLSTVAQALGVAPDSVVGAVERLQRELSERRQGQKLTARLGRRGEAERIAQSPTLRRELPNGIAFSEALAEDREGLMEIARSLTHGPDRVAVLSGEQEGRGVLFVGSSAPGVDAGALVRLVLDRFAGRGGGNASAGTAVGEVGAPLQAARAAAWDAAAALLSAGSGADPAKALPS